MNKMIECKECHSQDIRKDGIRIGDYDFKQRYKCKSCGYRFTEGERLRIPPNIRKFVLTQLKKKKYSSRKIRDMVNERFNSTISHTTITRMAKNEQK